MMPGIRSFGRVGVPSPAPVLDSGASLRNARPGAVDLRRQLQQHQQAQAQAQAQQLQQQRAEFERLVARPAKDQAATEDVAIAVPHKQSPADSRYSGGRYAAKPLGNTSQHSTTLPRVRSLLMHHRCTSTTSRMDGPSLVHLGSGVLSSSRQALVLATCDFLLDACSQSHLPACCPCPCSSGSEHEPSSEYLAGLVSDFMDVEERAPGSWRNRQGMVRPGSQGEEEEEESSAGAQELASSIRALSACASPLESRLYSDVLCAIQLARSTASLTASISSSKEEEASSQASAAAMRRAVMSRLRAAGYNAAVCKSRWDHSRGFPGGDYEYIDVVFASEAPSAVVPRERFIVDLDFRAQFQVARPTPQFEAALLAAPVVFVGRADRLQKLADALSDACRKSLKVQGMHLPPWRKGEYLRAKWLAPYKRTTNALSAPAAAAAQLPKTQGFNASELRVPQAPAAVMSTPFTAQLSFGQKHEFPQVPAAIKRSCLPAQRRSGPPRGSLGMLLQEQIGRKPSPVS